MDLNNSCRKESEMNITYGDIAALDREIAYAYSKVPFFRESLGPAGATSIPKVNSVRDLEAIPITSKPDYRKNFPGRILADGQSLNNPGVNRLQSSGTSGDRLISVIHAVNLAERMGNCLELNPDFEFLLDAPRIRACRYAAPNCSDVECSNPNTTQEQRILPDGTLVLPVHHDLLTTPESMLRVAFEELHSYEANIWYVDPMHFAFLISKAREKGWVFDIKQKVAIMLSYTLATGVLLRQINDLFKGRNPVAAVMAMSEFGFLGMQCNEHTLHLNNKDYFLEFQRIDNEQGEQGLFELLVTSVGDRLCPHVRYQTQDLYRILPPCVCGSRMPAVSFEGRRKDVVVLDSGKTITPGALDRAVGAPSWIDMYQLTNQGDGSFVFRYKGDASLRDEREIQRLREGLAELLEPRSLRLDAVDYFPFERGGKFQWIRAAT
jgi:phenylacetate-CoA ligase